MGVTITTMVTTCTTCTTATSGVTDASIVRLKLNLRQMLNTTTTTMDTLPWATTCTTVTSGTTTDSTNIRSISSYGTQMDLMQFFMKLQLPDQLPDSIISKLLVDFCQ